MWQNLLRVRPGRASVLLLLTLLLLLLLPLLLWGVRRPPLAVSALVPIHKTPAANELDGAHQQRRGKWNTTALALSASTAD